MSINNLLKMLRSHLECRGIYTRKRSTCRPTSSGNKHGAVVAGKDYDHAESDDDNDDYRPNDYSAAFGVDEDDDEDHNVDGCNSA